MRRIYVQAALLGLFVAATLPPLVVLCRGRSPSRFSPVNLPTWERKAPRPVQAIGSLRARLLPPSAVQFDPRFVQALCQTDENRLFTGLESAGRQPTLAAGNAGAWLEEACALGRQNPALAAKQDRVALRLMTDEDADGYLAAGQGRTRWTALQVIAESRNLRGLLACYALTRHVAVIDAATQAADLVVSAPELGAPPPRSVFVPPTHAPARPLVPVQTAPLVLPLTRLYLMTGQARYREWALRQMWAGHADAPGLCALFLATGQALFLHQAQAQWKRNTAQNAPNPDAAACLLAATGAPGYARIVRGAPAPWPCPLSPGSLAYTQTPHGLSVNAWANARFVWRGASWTQRTARLPSGAVQTVVTVSVKQPVRASLLFVVAGEAVAATVNRARVPIAPGQAVVTFSRVWHMGDQVSLTALPTPASAPPVLRPPRAVPMPVKPQGTQQSPAP